MVWGVGGWNMVCIGKVVESGVVVVCERTTGRCELRGSMRHDKLRDMGHFVTIRKRFIWNAITNRPHFLKTAYFNLTILNL
jgi:hypothetical protein